MASTAREVGYIASLGDGVAESIAPKDPRVTAWIAPVDRVLGAPGALDCLDAGDLRRAASFRQPSDRQRCLAGRVLLRHAMSAAVQPSANISPEHWRIRQDSCSKPCIAAGLGLPDLSISISHSAAMVAVACSGSGDVGIDIEQVERSGPVEECRHVMTVAEQRVIDETPLPGKWPQVVKFWCIKEACSKALGCGLTIDPSLICVDGDTAALDDDAFAKELRRPLHYWTHILTHADKPYTLAVARVRASPIEVPFARPLHR